MLQYRLSHSFLCDRMGRTQSIRLTAVCDRSDVLAGVTMDIAGVLCLTPRTPAGATAEATKKLLPPSSEQQNLLHCKRFSTSHQIDVTRRHGRTVSHTRRRYPTWL